MRRYVLLISQFIMFINISFSQEFKNISSFEYRELGKIICQKNGLYYLLAVSAGQYNPYIYKSTDFGYHWDVVYKDLDYADTNDPFKEALSITRMCAKDSILILGADSGYIIKSYNYGKTWKRVNLNSDFIYPYMIRNVKFAGLKYGIASTAYKIYFTDDNWESFKILELPDSMTNKGANKILYTTLSFPNENTIYISGYNSKQSNSFYLISSMDKGITWKMEPTSYIITDIVAYDSDFLIAQGMNTIPQNSKTKSILYSTEDRGKTWSKLIDTIHYPERSYFRNIENTSFIDKDNFAFSMYNFIGVTSDRGKTWKIVENTNLFYYPINGLFYLNKDSIVLATNNISQYNFVVNYNPNKTSVENNPTTINNISYYPNPSKDILNIMLDSEPLATEEIEVYDLLGQNLLTQKIDNMQTSINIQNLFTGIYYCKLKQNGTVFKFEVVK